jgi:hypothetical protein
MKWQYFPYAFCLKRNVPAKPAAIYLLLEGWKAELAYYNSPDEAFHYVTGEGLLSAAELNLAAKVIWGVKTEAPGPAEIIRNIEDNAGRADRA